MRLGLVGFGYWGQKLARVAEEHLSVICDTNHTVRVLAESRYPKIETVSDFRDVDADAVMIATPSRYHYDQAKYFASQGVHCLVEKPVTLNYWQTVDLVSRFSDDLILMPGYTFLYDSGVRWLKTHAESVQHVNMFRLNYGQFRDESALWSLAPHDVSMLLYWFGMPLQVRADRLSDDEYRLALGYPQRAVHSHISRVWFKKVRGVVFYTETERSRHVRVLEDRIGRAYSNGRLIHSEAFRLEPLAEEVKDFVGAVMQEHVPFISKDFLLDVHRILSLLQVSRGDYLYV